MKKDESVDNEAERRDALLLRLLKTPPQPRPKRERKDAPQKGRAAPKAKTARKAK